MHLNENFMHSLLYSQENTAKSENMYILYILCDTKTTAL